MPLYWNGVEITEVYFNGVKMDEVQFNGTQIFANAATDWVYLGTSGYTPDITGYSLTSNNLSCPSSSDADTYLTNAAPPSNYSIGIIAEVKTYKQGLFGNPAFCTNMYFEAQ